MTDILAYANRQSVKPGARIDFKISLIGAETYNARVVQLRGPAIGTGPHFPPAHDVEMASAVSGTHRGGRQPIQMGSWIRLDKQPVLPAAYTLCAFVSPTLLKKPGRQTIIGSADVGLALEKGHLVGLAGGKTVQGAKLAKFRWYFVALSVGADGSALLYQQPVTPHMVERHETVVTRAAPGTLTRGNGAFAIAASCDAKGWPSEHFNGKIERPRILARALTEAVLATLAAAGSAIVADRDAVADWDFSFGISGDAISDVSGHGHDGRAIQMPVRGAAGIAWKAGDANWSLTPQSYGAIHFHETDMVDAGWETSLSLEIPRDWQSGCYALKLTSGAAEWEVPFFVVPGAQSKRSDIALLLPTATYAAYANHLYRMTKPWHEGTQGRLITVDATDLLILRYPEIGRSSYDTHSDGSSVYYTSLRRPVVNFRSSGRPYKFTQDLLIVAWLETLGVGYDIITDSDLHDDGAALLDNYRVVMSGSHPEYWSEPMLDGLESWLNSGGRFMAIGGNSIWWTTEWHAELPGIAEVRRLMGGDFGQFHPGDRHFSMSGRLAGGWIGAGRASPLYVGVGNTIQGNDVCAGYRVSAARNDPRAAFIFDGIADDVVGDFGVLGNGAAGFEIDRVDHSLGTPAHTLVLASSFGHSTNFESDIPEKVYMRTLAASENAEPIRADMVFFETPNGGAVFSVGSIAYSGALSWNGSDNNIARLTRNVLSRFVDPKPFNAG